MNCAGRLERYCATDGPDNVLVSRMHDIRWLTGFTGSTAQLFVDRANVRAFLFVDGRYLSRAQSEVARSHAAVEVVLVDGAQTTHDFLQKNVVGPLAVNFGHITAEKMKALSESFTVVEEGNHLDRLRRVKDALEIALMEKAAAIADAALLEVVADGLVGKTEKQIRNQLEYRMRDAGADGPGFSTIVASGHNGASAHHEPSDKVVHNGEGVVIDMGAELDGYRSDMTRTIFVGQVPEQYREMFEIVREAQQVGVDAVRDGVSGAEVDGAVRVVFAQHGCEHEFVHGTGHGIGLYIHEMPILSPRCGEVLQAGEVVTVEPGLYRGGVGGVRIEDQVVVTDTGCRSLTLSPKDLSCPQSPQMI